MINMSEYVYQLLSELKEANNKIGYNDSRNTAIRESRIKELKRLGVKIPRSHLRKHK